jgi:hypothetical protein
MSYYDPFDWIKDRWSYQQLRFPGNYTIDDPLQQLSLNRYQKPVLYSSTCYGSFKPKSLYYWTTYWGPIIWR